MPYFVVDGSNDIRATYDGPAANAPAGAVAVTEAILAALPFPFTGWKYASGALVAPTTPSPTLAQQAAAMLATGIEIASTGTPALNATYPCDANTQNQDGNLLAAVNASLTFPGGVVTRLDVTGAPHFFTTTAFKNYCQAKLTFLQTLETIIGSNSGTLPSLPVTIA